MATFLASLFVGPLMQLVGTVIMYSIITITASISTTLMGPLVNAFGSWMTSWVDIPIISTVILWGQCISIVLACGIRVFEGLRAMASTSTGSNFSLGEYIFKSVGSIALVGLMPIFCSLIISFGTTMMTDLMGITSTQNLSITCGWESLYTDSIETQQGAVNALASTMVSNILVLIAVGMVVAVLYQIMKRQFQMLVVSVAAPWIGIKAASNDDAQVYGEYLMNLFGMCVIQWLQYLFMIVGINMLAAFLNGGDLATLTLFDPANQNNLDAFVQIILCLAVLGATLSVPNLIDRWTFTGGASSMGNMMLGMMVRRAASPIKMPSPKLSASTPSTPKPPTP